MFTQCWVLQRRPENNYFNLELDPKFCLQYKNLSAFCIWAVLCISVQKQQWCKNHVSVQLKLCLCACAHALTVLTEMSACEFEGMVSFEVEVDFVFFPVSQSAAL